MSNYKSKLESTNQLKIKTNEYKISEKNDFLFNLKFANSYNVIEKSQELKNDIDKLIKFENLAIDSERPDIIFFDDTSIIGIEQMDFSSYCHNKRKGDLQLKRYNQTFNEDFEKLIRKGKVKFKSKTLFLKCSNENYENSFIEIFDKHYKKIGDYIANLNKFNKPVKLYFLMSNKTLEHTYAKLNKNNIKYNPTYNRKILEYLKGKDKVDGFIFEEPFFEKKDYYYLENNDVNIEKLLEKNQDYFNYNITNNKTKITTWCTNLC